MKKAIFALLLIPCISFAQQKEAQSDTTIATKVAVETLLQQHKQLLEQKKQIEDNLLRLEGQIAILSAMTSDSVKIKKN